MVQSPLSSPTTQEASPIHPDHAPIPPVCHQVHAVLGHDLHQLYILNTVTDNLKIKMYKTQFKFAEINPAALKGSHIMVSYREGFS